MVISMDETLLRGFHSVMKRRPFISVPFHRVKKILHLVKSIASNCEVEDDLCAQKDLSRRFVDTVQLTNAYKSAFRVTCQAIDEAYSRGKPFRRFRFVSTVLPGIVGLQGSNICQYIHAINPLTANYATLLIGEETHGPEQ